MTMQLQQSAQIVLFTGAGSGIGRAVATVLASNGDASTSSSTMPAC